MDVSGLPGTSTPLPWHARQWAHLNDLLEKDQLPHALLLVGRQHIGKSQLALALSRLLLCSRADGSLNCGQCHACDLSASGAHGDFRWVEPQEKSRVIKIEQIRDVVHFTNRTAGFGLRKVIVLAPADTLNINAFNALLKPLEEPANDTYIILVCNRLFGVPATIRSRCHIVRLPTPAPQDCLDWLDETTGKRENSRELLALADGLPLVAERLFHTGGAKELAQRQLGLEALLLGKVSPQQAAALWGEVEVNTFLDRLATGLQHRVLELSTEGLRTKQGRTLFGLMDEVVRLQKAINAGANPNQPLLVDAMLSKIHRQLGPRHTW